MAHPSAPRIGPLSGGLEEGKPLKGSQPVFGGGVPFKTKKSAHPSWEFFCFCSFFFSSLWFSISSPLIVWFPSKTQTLLMGSTKKCFRSTTPLRRPFVFVNPGLVLFAWKQPTNSPTNQPSHAPTTQPKSNITYQTTSQPTHSHELVGLPLLVSPGAEPGDCSGGHREMVQQ